MYIEYIHNICIGIPFKVIEAVLQLELVVTVFVLLYSSRICGKSCINTATFELSNI
jgi:hypothetical protein